MGRLRRIAIWFSTDAQVRALRASTNRLEKLLGEVYAENSNRAALVHQLNAALQHASADRDKARAELEMYSGRHINGQLIGNA